MSEGIGVIVGRFGELSEVISHTIVALVVMAGGFTMMVVSMVDGRPIPDNTMTLLTVLMSGVVGWFFGTHSTLSGMYAQQSAPPVIAPAADAPGPETAAH